MIVTETMLPGVMFGEPVLLLIVTSSKERVIRRRVGKYTKKGWDLLFELDRQNEQLYECCLYKKDYT